MKALIIGYYGSENIGDEVLLHQTIKMIQEIDENIEIKSLSYRTLMTKELHNIDAISRNKYFDIIKGIKDADIVIGGGGSILQNVTSNRSLVYYLMIFLISKLFGKKVILLGNGFGPVNGGFYRNFSKWVLNKTDVFLARDQETKERLRDLGVNSSIVLSADLAYYNYKESTYEKNKKILINVRPWKDSEKIALEMKAFVSRLIASGYEVEFLSMQEGKDDVLLKEINNEIPFIENSIDRFLHKNSDYFCMIGMRLHALIWAGIKDIPFISLQYDPKIEAYAEMTGQLNYGDVNGIDSEKLWEAFNILVNHYESKRKKLIEANVEMAKRANINLAELKKIMEMSQ
ncbi:MAG: polysaccharide pyruvyl transferase CsaB [Clostridiales bacterium]|nr:polysaccharide pyruvyl transferase CsaB [Clostridiales bacterium]